MTSRVEQFKKERGVAPSKGGSSRVQQFKKELAQRQPAPEAAPTPAPQAKRNPLSGIGKGIVNDLIKPATLGLVEMPLQGLASGIRSIQSIPKLIKGVIETVKSPRGTGAFDEANKTMAKPIAGVKPLQGMTKTEALTGPGLSAGLSLFGAKGQAGKVAESFAAKQTAKAEKKALEETLEVVREPLTKKVKERALQEGRITTKGALKQTVVEPSQREREIAEVVKDVVSKKNSATQNIQAIKSKIAETGKRVEAGLQQNNAIFNKNQLRTVISKTKEESRVVFGSDKTIENTYDAVVEEFMRKLDDNPKNLSGLWKARIRFDTTIEKKFPNIFSKFGRDDVRANAVQDVRRAVNDYIADTLPEGNPFKQELKHMNLMYDAQKNIYKKGTSEIGKNAIARFGDKHPTLKKAAKTTAKYAIPSGLIYGGSKLFK